MNGYIHKSTCAPGSDRAHQPGPAWKTISGYDIEKRNSKKKSYSVCKVLMYVGACSYGINNVCVWVWIHMRLY